MDRVWWRPTMSALFEAVHKGDLEAFERLISDGADLDAKEGSGSPLHEALRLGRLDMARRLVTAGADVNATIGDGYAPLRIAIASGDIALTAFLISQGADVNTATKYGETPLHAVKDPAMAELLLSNGADVDARALDGGAPLHYAAWWDRIPIVRLLLAHGADPNTKTVFGETPLHVARTTTFRVLASQETESTRDLLERHGGHAAEPRIEVPDSGLDPRILRPYVEVYDGLVPPDLLDQAWAGLNRPIWGFGLGTFRESHYKHARTSIPLSDPMVQSMCRLIEPKLPYRSRLINVYANANRTGDADEVHKDGDEPGYPTAILYANPRWEPEWAGETVFYNETRDEFVRSVYPRPGRIAIFDGRIWHNARVPTRHYGGIRVTVVFSFEHTGFQGT
jgi:hypothetical protein